MRLAISSRTAALEYVVKRTEPSARSQLAPPEWKLQKCVAAQGLVTTSARKRPGRELAQRRVPSKLPTVYASRFGRPRMLSLSE